MVLYFGSGTCSHSCRAADEGEWWQFATFFCRSRGSSSSTGRAFCWEATSQCHRLDVRAMWRWMICVYILVMDCRPFRIYIDEPLTQPAISSEDQGDYNSI